MNYWEKKIGTLAYSLFIHLLLCGTKGISHCVKSAAIGPYICYIVFLFYDAHAILLLPLRYNTTFSPI